MIGRVWHWRGNKTWFTWDRESINCRCELVVSVRQSEDVVEAALTKLRRTQVILEEFEEELDERWMIRRVDAS